METPIFYSRDMYDCNQLQTYINLNQISQEQIVSINNYSTYYGDRHYNNHQCNLNFFHKGELKFDLFKNLNDEIKELLKNKKINFGEFDEESLGWVKDMFIKFKIPDNFSKSTLKILFIYPSDTLMFPTKFENLPTKDLDYLKYVIQLNPEIKIQFTFR